MSDKIGTIRYVSFGAYHDHCAMQIEDEHDKYLTDYLPFDASTGVPIVFDLDKIKIGEKDKFKLHSKVKDQHIHSDKYTFSKKGGLLYGGICDSQGHFSEIQYVGPDS